MSISAIVLWVHVLAGVIWIAAALTFSLAAIATERGSRERLEFFKRGARPLAVLGLVAAATIVVSGVLNVWFVGRRRDFVFATGFKMVLASKVALYIGMCLALFGIIRESSRISAADEAGCPETIEHAGSRLVIFWSAIVIMGFAALLAGLWLAGS
jgi:hypothetical protein